MRENFARNKNPQSPGGNATAGTIWGCPEIKKKKVTNEDQGRTGSRGTRIKAGGGRITFHSNRHNPRGWRQEPCGKKEAVECKN